jgi:hypothetical protein
VEAKKKPIKREEVNLRFMSIFVCRDFKKTVWEFEIGCGLHAWEKGGDIMVKGVAFIGGGK